MKLKPILFFILVILCIYLSFRMTFKTRNSTLIYTVLHIIPLFLVLCTILAYKYFKTLWLVNVFLILTLLVFPAITHSSVTGTCDTNNKQLTIGAQIKDEEIAHYFRMAPYFISTIRLCIRSHRKCRKGWGSISIFPDKWFFPTNRISTYYIHFTHFVYLILVSIMYVWIHIMVIKCFRLKYHHEQK